MPPTVACIGPVTADTARRHGLRVDVVADVHTIPGLVDALVAHVGRPGADAAASRRGGRSTGPCVGCSTMSFPQRRLRRLRRTPTLRRLVAETRLSVDDLIAPLFVREGIDEPQPIASLPGVVQHTRRVR